MRKLSKPMYYRSNAGNIEAARILRKNMTRPELLLWEMLRRKQILGVRFRRQHPVFMFIADFYCHQAKLVVEVDGGIHLKTLEYDDGRAAEMEKFGIKTIRFSNEEVENYINKVVERIKTEVSYRISSPPWGI